MDTYANSTSASLVYNGGIIQQRDEMLSLTDMWRAAKSPDGRGPSDWRSLPETVRFVEFLVETFIAGKSGNEVFQVVRGGRNPGTFAHWQIGLAYAKYLSPEFHMWCNTVVRERMEGRASSAGPSDGFAAPFFSRPRVTSETFKAYFTIGKLIGLDQNQSAIAANNATRKTLGIDALAAMETTHFIAPQQANLLTRSPNHGQM